MFLALFARHVHLWAEVARTYSPPQSEHWTCREYNEAFLRAALKVQCGFTSIAYGCSDPTCDATRVVELVGQESR